VILGLCGFADLLRRHGGDVGSAELIDAATALTLVDLSDRRAVRRALEFTFAWSTVHPELFDQLFDQWFSGRDLVLVGQMGEGVGQDAEADDDVAAVALDAETIEAARIHADDAIAVEGADDPGNERPDAASGTERSPAGTPSPTMPTLDDGISLAATGELAPAPPNDEGESADSSSDLITVELPDAPLDAELELARGALADAIERRRQVELVHAPRRVRALSQPLSADERSQLGRYVKRLDRRLDGAPSWRRARHHRGTIDLRRTMRQAVTNGGLPIDLRHTGRRDSSPRLIVLVDLSMSVRGTARLVLHLVHRLRSMRGTLRAFGFVDSCVPIDRALRVADPAVAIERVLGMVDVDAASDPGLAMRRWWARSHHLVTPEAHVLILGDGRCNGRDPAFEVVGRIAQRSASTLWVSPEPPGAWTLGRGEMADYAKLVDRAVTVREIGDLEQLVTSPRPRAA
jgi:uncharacterized protein with von Willebrand factor type A (vWA) domain